HLDRGDREALADRQVAHRRAGVVGGLGDDPVRLARDVDARRAPEAELADPAVEAPGAEAQPDLDGPDVRRLRQDLGDRQAQVAVRLGVVARAVRGPAPGRGRQTWAGRLLAALTRG